MEKVTRLITKKFKPHQCGWLLLDKKRRLWETPAGIQVRFQPHEEEVVNVEVKSQED
jgi:hypothetical protein